jgi:DNA-binding CsgD family transcriptional regulator
MLTSEIENLRDLTIREMEVLDLVREGMRNKEIADVLYISERTVKFHVANLLRKFKIDTHRPGNRISLIFIKL